VRLKEENLSHIHVMTDSDYVRKGINEWMDQWKKNNYLKPDRSEIVNSDLWRNMNNVIDYYKTTNTTITVDWIKSHSGNEGNVQADILAAIGVNHSICGDLINNYTVSPSKGYWKSDIEKHPFISYRSLFFNSVSKYNEPGVYFLADTGSNDLSLGRRLADTGYSVIKLNSPNNVIEGVKEKQYAVNKGSNAIFSIKLDSVFSKKLYPTMSLNSVHSVNKHRKNNNLIFVDDSNTPVTTEINPTGLSLRAVDSFNYLEEILDRYIVYQSDPNVPNPFDAEYIDVTSVFYNIEVHPAKHKQVLKPEFNVGYRELKIPIIRNNVEISVPIILGTDILTRNNLKKIESSKPTVCIVTWSESLGSFRYATIIQCVEGVGIWSNFYADKVFI
jgi:hypothetical protein